MKNVSVIIPSLNDAKILNNCLESIRYQIYDQDKIEIVVVDGGSKDNTREICNQYKAKYILDKSGSPEIAKGIGVKNSKGEIILFLDCDNIIPTINWLKEMVEVFCLEKKVVGVYTRRYKVRKNDKILNRYFALFGVNDIVAWFLGKADRQSYLNEDWNLLGKVEDKGNYYLVSLEKNKIPTLGANGFLIKKEMLEKAKIDGDDFFHIDVNVDLINQSLNKYVVYKNDIVHVSGESVWKFFEKRKRYMNELYMRDFEKRRYFLYDPKKDLIKIILYCLYSLSVILPLITSLKGYMRKRDLAWFLHPIICLGMMWIYAEIILNRFLNYDKFINRIRFAELRNYYLKNKQNIKVLDVGCGKGIFINILINNNCRALGIDTKKFRNPNVIKSSFENYKNDFKYDVITMYHFIEHTKNPLFILHKANRTLKKNGKLIVETPLIGNFTEMFLKTNYFAYFDKTHINLFTDEKLRNILSETGFKIEKNGFTLFQFPLTLINSGFKKGLFFGIMAIITFFPFKILQIIGINKEIVRYYCKKIN